MSLWPKTDAEVEAPIREVSHGCYTWRRVGRARLARARWLGLFCTRIERGHVKLRLLPAPSLLISLPPPSPHRHYVSASRAPTTRCSLCCAGCWRLADRVHVQADHGGRTQVCGSDFATVPSMTIADNAFASNWRYKSFAPSVTSSDRRTRAWSGRSRRVSRCVLPHCCSRPSPATTPDVVRWAVTPTRRRPFIRDGGYVPTR